MGIFDFFHIRLSLDKRMDPRNVNMYACIYVSIYICMYVYVCKGKSVPLQVWGGPEGSRKLRFPDFMTTAQDNGKVVSLTQRPPLPLGNTPGTHFC